MITSTSILFSASSIRRILGLSSAAAVRFQVWQYVIWVHVSGCRPTMISKKKFYSHFAQYRQEAGYSLREEGQVTRVSGTGFIVNSNSNPDGFQTVTLSPEGVSCTCNDYRNQISFWGKGCCKHGYAAIATLGLFSLSDYMQAAAIATSQTQFKHKREAAPVAPRVSNHRRTAMMAGC